MKIVKCPHKVSKNTNLKIKLLVFTYYKHHYQAYENYLSDYKKMGSTISTFNKIAHAKRKIIKNGSSLYKEDPHQYHLGRKDIKKRTIYKAVYLKLKTNKSQIMNIKYNRTFEDLVNVLNCIHNIRGVGDLMLYDTALRVGAYIGILPQKKVYVHSGPKDGINKLFPYLSKKSKAYTIDINSFNHVPELRKLGAYHIEHFLCIYDDGKLRF